MDRAKNNIACSLLVWVAILVCAPVSIGRADEPLFSEPWRWATFTTDSGLPSNEILDLVETETGTTWVATRSGVAWFDGYRWIAAGKAQGLREGLPTTLAPFGADQVLVVLQQQLFVGGTSGFKEIDLVYNGEAMSVTGAAALDAGRILAQARPPRDTGWAIFIYDAGKVTMFDPPKRISAMPRTRLQRTRDGSVWLSTDVGLSRWSGESWEMKQTTATDWYRIGELATNKNGEGLVDTIYPRPVAGLWTWRGNDPLVRDEVASRDPIASADVDPQGNILAVCRSRCVKYRRGGQWVSVQPVPTRMEVVSFVRFGSKGDLWVGTPVGLHLYRSLSSRWEFWQEGSSPQQIVNALAAARDGTIWIGTGEGIDHRRADGTLIESFAGLPGISFAPVTGFAEDRDGGIWACSGSAFDGAVRWDGRTWKHVGQAEGLDAPFVHRIYKDRTGHLWFMGMGTYSRIVQEGPGAFRLVDGRFEKWGLERGLPSGRMYSMAEAVDGTLWFGTLAGLSRFRDGRWKHWAVADGLRHSKVFTIAITPDDRVWFGHQGQGMGYIDDQDRVQYIESPAALAHTYVLDLQLDRQGRLWVGSSNGLFSLHNGIWSEFSRMCGLVNTFVWPVVPLEDRVIVGTDGSGAGVLHITPLDRAPPRVVVNAPAVEGSSAWVAWSAFAYQATIPASSVETRCRLDEQPWSPWSAQRGVTLRSLSSGRHRFEVQAKGLFGDMDQGAAAEFEITPPFFVRPNFVGPVGLLTGVVIVLATTLLRRQRRHAHVIAASQRQMQSILDNTPAVIYMKDPKGIYISINKRYEDLFHITREAVVGKTDYDIFSANIADAFRANDLRVLQDGRSLLIEEVAPHDDGAHSYISAKFPIYNADGSCYAVCGISTDITAGKQAEERLRVSEERLRATFTQAAVGISETDLDGRYLLVNQRFCDIVGYTRDELLERTFFDVTHRDDLSDDLEQFRKLLSGEIDRYSVQKRYVRKDGSLVWVNLAVAAVRDATGHPRYAAAVVEDITERKHAETDLAERAQHAALAAKVGIAFTEGGELRTILQRCAEAIVEHLDVALARIWTYHKAEDLLQLRASAGLYTHIDGKHGRIKPGEFKIGRIAQQRRAHLTNAVRGDPEIHDQAWAERECLTSFAGHPLIVQDRMVGVIAVFARRALTDATAQMLESVGDVIAIGIDHNRAEQALHRQALVFDNINDGVILTDTAGRIVDWNPGAERIFGYDREAMLGKSPNILNRADEAETVSCNIRDGLFRDGRWEGEIGFIAKEGTQGIAEVIVVPLYDENHRQIGTVSVNRDITARKRSEEEKELLEAQLRQAQKMEAIGTLASGVAHDFNNLLQAIFGYTDLAKATLPPDHAGITSIEMVEQAARQARGVINALLTFSRKSVTEKATVNLTTVVHDSVRLLRRVVPAAIEIVERADPDLWGVADATQVQQVIMNLAVNARDAMPSGGHLSITLAKTSASEENGTVDLTVQDTGVGMSDEVRARLFEPFFTTKPRGQGTGLGMSILHGIVTDHGGRIQVDSAMRRGTKVTITLPSCPEPSATAPASMLKRDHGRGETVLVVEDNEHVRSIITSTLRSHGYVVLAAGDAEQAVVLLVEARDAARVIVLDVDLPKPDHLPELKRLATELGLVLILISGAVDPAASYALKSDHSLRKPFQMHELTELVSQVLSGEPTIAEGRQ